MPKKIDLFDQLKNITDLIREIEAPVIGPLGLAICDQNSNGHDPRPPGADGHSLADQLVHGGGVRFSFSACYDETALECSR